jgi:hypothetical protein
MSRLFHVTSILNRESIRVHGLDWGRMGAARGIAGSSEPELEGCFLCLDEGEADWFVHLNNTGGAVDVWAVDGVKRRHLIVEGNGHSYLPKRIPAEQLSLVQTDVPPRDRS